MEFDEESGGKTWFSRRREVARKEDQCLLRRQRRECGKGNKKYSFLRKQRFMRERETHFSENGREVSEKERENKEQRNKKLGKMFYIKLQ